MFLFLDNKKMKSLLLIVLASLIFENAFAQIDDPLSNGTFDFSLSPIDEAILEDDASSAFILDNTKTKIARELYDEFYRQWNSLQLDSTSIKKLKTSLNDNPDLVIEIEEIPSPGLSNMAMVKVDQVVVWQQFVQSRAEILEIQASEAVQEVISYFISLQDVQDQLGLKDQSGTGIY